MDETLRSIQELFEERKKFVLIGLTGRTGSGCSTMAELMTKEWTNFDAPRPQSGSFVSNEERKYRILYDFAEKNWSNFEWIQVKDVITSFLLEESFDDFTEFVSNDFAKKGFSIDKQNPLLLELSERYQEYHSLSRHLRLDEEDESQLSEKSNEYYSFYFDKLPAFTKDIRETFKKLSQNAYTRLYQIIGDNIRSSGQAIRSDFSPENIFAIAKRINKIIKLLRDVAKKKDGHTFVVIDAIRNPFEATFFRDRYTAFYLTAVNCPNEDRIARLQESYDYSRSQIQEIDRKEYEEKLEGSKLFISQNISRCIEISDIFFRNQNQGEKDLSFLKRQIIWYVTLMMHPGIVTPTSYEHAMQIAYNARLGSGCISRQVGAVVTDRGVSIKSVGWNNTPQGQVPCLLRSTANLLRHDDKEAYSDYENDDGDFRDILKRTLESRIGSNRLCGRNLSFCFKDVRNSVKEEKNQIHTRSLHAEENAFLQISKHGGQGLKNGFLFTTASPCELCAKKAFQLGISEIFYIDPYPGIAGEHVLTGGKNGPKLTLFSGAIGRAYQQLFQPVLPYKDELEMILGFKWPSAKKNLEEENLEKQIEILKSENEALKRGNLDTASNAK
jgi:dCMP deaminase